MPSLAHAPGRACLPWPAHPAIAAGAHSLSSPSSLFLFPHFTSLFPFSLPPSPFSFLPSLLLGRSARSAPAQPPLLRSRTRPAQPARSALGLPCSMRPTPEPPPRLSTAPRPARPCARVRVRALAAPRRTEPRHRPARTHTHRLSRAHAHHAARHAAPLAAAARPRRRLHVRRPVTIRRAARR